MGCTPENAEHRTLKLFGENFLTASRSIYDFLFLKADLRFIMQFDLSSLIFHTFYQHISYFLGEL